MEYNEITSSGIIFQNAHILKKKKKKILEEDKTLKSSYNIAVVMT